VRREHDLDWQRERRPQSSDDPGRLSRGDCQSLWHYVEGRHIRAAEIDAEALAVCVGRSSSLLTTRPRSNLAREARKG